MQPRLLAGALALVVLLSAGCTMPAMPSMPAMANMPAMPDLSKVDLKAVTAMLPGGDDGVEVRVRSVPLRIALAATSAAITVAADGYLGMDADPVELLSTFAGVELVDVPRTLDREALAEVAAEGAASVRGRYEATASLEQMLVAQRGLPSAKAPVLMVISKATNEMLYWEISDAVKAISLSADQSAGVEMKVINEDPLRIEVWVDSGVEDVVVTVDVAE
jgi:hypothetical protein